MWRLISRGVCVFLLLVWTPLQTLAAPAQRGGIVLTFDDWYVDQWYAFFTDLKATNPEIDVKATFFVAKWLQPDVSGDDYVKLKLLENAGHEIGSHSINHVGVDEAPYLYLSNMADQYYANEVAPSLSAMAAGDPTIANDYGFTPKSFSYPSGSRAAAFDTAIKNNGLRYLRGTTEITPSKPMNTNDEIYHKPTDVRPYLLGDGLDKFYQNDLPEVEAALTRASQNDEIITLYAHRILPDNGADHNFGIYASKLKAIILKANSLGLKFYRFSDAFQEGTPTSGGGSNNPGSPNISVAIEAGNRVRLNWTNTANDFIGIVPANQTEWQNGLPGVTTGGTASGKVGITVSGAIPGQQYIALFYLNNIKVANSSPFVVVEGTPPPPPTPTAPATATNLTAQVVSSTQVNLSWQDNSTNETGFKVERCQGGNCSNFVEISAVAANVTSFSDTILQASTVYQYRVRAYNSTAYASSYPVVTVTTPATSGGGGTNPGSGTITTSTETGNRVRLNWSGLPSDFIGIVPVNQTAWQSGMPGATTNGSASGKLGITVKTPVAGQAYVALFYLNNVKVGSSQPFVF